MRSSRLSNTQPMSLDVCLNSGYGLTSQIGTEASSSRDQSYFLYVPASSHSIFRAALDCHHHHHHYYYNTTTPLLPPHHHIAMAQLTEADLNDSGGLYKSPRGFNDVLIGEDAAGPIIEAISSGDDTALQSLLSQPQWIKLMFEKPLTIHYESRPRQGPDDVREVHAMRWSNLERAVTAAAANGQAAAMSTLLAFAKQQGVETSDIIHRWPINRIIGGDHAAVYRVLASADPNLINFPYLGHGTLPLYEAVRRRSPEVAAVLLELGADPFNPVGPMKKIGGYSSSLLAHAARAEGTRMTEILLERGLPIPESAALHSAASCGHLDTMRLLIEHGADVSEVLPNSGWFSWTPMHFAATRGRADAMKLLEDSGARSDLKDKKGRTPAQLLEFGKGKTPQEIHIAYCSAD